MLSTLRVCARALPKGSVPKPRAYRLFSNVRVAQLGEQEPREQTEDRLKTWSKGGRTEQFSTDNSTEAGNVATKGGISVEEFRKEHEITIKAPRDVTLGEPIRSFTGAPKSVTKYTKLVKSFPSPSPIQAEAWPLALEGHDIVSIAKTGSGKTLGFLLPGFNHILNTARRPNVGRIRATQRSHRGRHLEHPPCNTHPGATQQLGHPQPQPLPPPPAS